MIEPGTPHSERLNFAQRLRDALSAAQQPTQAGALARAYNLLADGTPVSTHGVRKWLLGESFPTQEKIMLLAKWLNVQPSWLLFGDVEQQETPKAGQGFSSQQIMLLHDVASLTAPAQVIIRELVDSFIRITVKGQIGLITQAPVTAPTKF